MSPGAKLDLSKVRAIVDDDADCGRRRADVLAGNQVQQLSARPSGELAPFQRRYSDLEAMARAAVAAKAAASAWAHSRRHRKSLGDVEFPMERAQDDSAVLRRKSAAQERPDVDAARGKRYAEMMERFQIRRVAAPGNPHFVVTSRSISTARSAKVHPCVSENGDTNTDGTERYKSGYYRESTKQSRTHSLTSVGRGSQHQVAHSVYIPEERAVGEAAESSLPTLPPRLVLCKVKYHVATPFSLVSDGTRARSVVLLVIFAFHAVYFPLDIAFFSPRESPGAVHFDIVINLILLADCFVTLNTSYFDKRGNLVLSRAAIARNYARTWLVPDLLSSIPSECLLSRGGNEWINIVADGVLRFIRYFHAREIARVAWVRRLDESDNSLFTWLFYSRYSHLMRIVVVIFSIVIGAHYVACMLKLLSPTANGSPQDPLAEYVSNLYDALQLLQGQGVPATSVGEGVFGAMAVLVGSLALAIVFGHVAILVANFNANSTNYQRKMESVFAIMSKLQLPAPLRERIHQYYEHLWREYESLDGEIVAFSKGLSHTLELEVVLFKYMDLIMHVPFWRDGSPDFQKQLMLNLHVRVYLPDDFIIRRGEVGDEFFMINRGVCELIVGSDSLEYATEPLDDDPVDDVLSRDHDVTSGVDGSTTARNDCYDRVQAPLTARRKPGTDSSGREAMQLVHVLRRGQSFGEMALLTNYERTANVRALTYVEMCVLKRADVQSIFVKHPKDRRDVIRNIVAGPMENREKNKFPCSLRESVESIFGIHDPTRHDSVSDTESLPMTISAAHAALLIATAVDVEKEDPSVRYGIRASLHEQLVNLKTRERGFSLSPRVDRSGNATDGEPPKQDTFSSSSSAKDINQRLERLQLSQRHLLAAMENLRHELRAAREC